MKHIIGMDSAILESLHEAAKDVPIQSIVTVKDGVVIDEYYKEGFNENSVIRIASCTKSFSSALIGIAIDQGLIPGVDTKISEYFPQIADSDDTLKKEITLEHLLTHTSGLEWNEWNGGNSFGELRRAENWVDFILAIPMPPSIISAATSSRISIDLINKKGAVDLYHSFRAYSEFFYTCS